jgi:C4-dicarboxylate-specific signal transduction histidine kinase
MAQLNDSRQNMEERANGLANDLQAILQRLQHIPHVAENASNHEDEVEELLHELQENKKNTDKELLSMLEDLLVEGMVMEEMEVVKVED